MKNILSIILSVLILLFPTGILHAQEVKVKSTPGNPWWYKSQLVFSLNSNEVARQQTDEWGNLTPVSGQVPKGIVQGYDDQGKLIMDLNFDFNKANGLGHSYSEGSMSEEKHYKNGKLEGIQIGYYPDGTVKTAGEWMDGKPIGIHKLYDKEGRLQMESSKDKERSFERSFYLNGNVKLERSYEGGKIVEVRDYAPDGTLRIHATQYAPVSNCTVKVNKYHYSDDEPAEFFVACHCQDPDGCFTPEEFGQKNFFSRVVLRDEASKEYQLVYSPTAADAFTDSSYLQQKYTFKDGDTITELKIPGSKEFRFVPKDKYSSCAQDIGCQNKVFNEGIGKIPLGSFTVWLENGDEPARVNFTVEAKK